MKSAIERPADVNALKVSYPTLALLTLALGFAGCGGGGGSATPPVTTPVLTPTPVATPSLSPAVASTSGALSTGSATTLSFGGVSNGSANVVTSATVTVPAASVASTLSASMQTNVPTGFVAPSAREVKMRAHQASLCSSTCTITPLAYFSRSVSTTTAITTSPAFTLVLPSNVTVGAGNAYLVAYVNGAWQELAGPVTASNSLTFPSGPTNPSPLTLSAGTNYVFAIVTTGSAQLPAILTSLTLAPAANQSFLKSSSVANYALVGNWQQQFTVSPLDQHGQPFTGTVPALNVTSSDPNVQVSVDANAQMTIDVTAKALASGTVKLQVTAGAASGSATIETQQALWVLNALGTPSVSAYQIGNSIALAQLSNITTPSVMGTDPNGDLLVAESGGLGSSAMQFFAPGGSLTATLQLSAAASSVAVDHGGNCWFSASNALIEDPNCSPTATTSSHSWILDGGLSFDSNGNVWVGNITGYPTAYEGVYSDTTLSTQLFTITDTYSGPGVAVFDAAGKAYVPFSGFDGLNTHGGNVLQGTVANNAFTTTNTLSSSSGLVAPFGLAIDAKQNLWVANGTNVLEFAAGTLAPVSASTVTLPSGSRATGVLLLPAH